jgi:hypothetical protein
MRVPRKFAKKIQDRQAAPVEKLEADIEISAKRI